MINYDRCSRVRAVLISLVLAALLFLVPRPFSAQTSPTIVLWTSNVPASDIHGDWVRASDPTAAGGVALQNPNLGAAKLVPAKVAPSNYFEVAFNAEANVPYRLWLRMRATANSTANDSVHVQFSDAVDASGAPVARIGTTSSFEPVLQAGTGAAAPQHWGWADTGWGSPGPPIAFANSGTHVVRVQQREDGAILDQIILSPDTYLTNAPGPRLNDTTVLEATGGEGLPPPSMADTVVLWAGDADPAAIVGSWDMTAAADAAGGTALQNPNASHVKIAPALAAPDTYFEMTFPATAGIPYHVWVRMRADGNSTSNDSIHMQFDDARDAGGAPAAAIGTTASAEFVLQPGTGGATPQGWGWTENGWDAYGPHVYFATTGTQRLRIQQREDGVSIDQIVISADAFLTTAPGGRRNDTTILPRTTTTANRAPTVAITAPADGAAFTAPADITITASATDPEGQLTRVDFYQGSTLVGSDASEPYGLTWTGAPAGTYTVTANAIDAAGAETTSAPVTVSVTTANQPPTVTLTAPAHGATFVAPATVTLTASAADPEDQLARVEFFSGSTLLASDAAPPYWFSWSSVGAGAYSLTAVAVDGEGLRTTSAAAAVTVQPNQPPSVTMTAPATGATFVAPATVMLTADATDPEGQLTRVDFYSGPTLLGGDSSPPYSFSWTSVPAGTYSLTARALDAAGDQMASPAVTITVGNPPPPQTFVVAFTASTDHDTAVTSYRLDVFSNGANPNTATPMTSSDLGRPTPDAAREIRVDRTTFLGALAPGTYGVTVSAIGPGGLGRSALYSFVR
jgi:hypothetical protein